MIPIIERVQVSIRSVPLAGEWQISLYAATEREHAIIEVITDQGIVGIGEASPSPAFMGESARTIALVIDEYLGPAIVGLPVDALARVHAAMDGAIHGQTAAKSAIDIALHDAWGQGLGLPVHALLGGRFRDSVPLCYVVGIKSDDAVADELARVVAMGFPAIKLKIGRDPERDLRLVDKAFATLADAGGRTRLRLDANQGYDVATAVRVIRRIEAMGELDAIEQPIVKSDLLGLAEIRRQVATPVMIDETVFSVAEAMAAIRLNSADAINIKICKVGGLYPATRIAGIAAAAGLACTVGSNLELGVGIAASLHFAVSNPAVTLPADFICGAYLHDGDLTAVPARDWVVDGHGVASEQAGLGIELGKAVREAG